MPDQPKRAKVKATVSVGEVGGGWGEKKARGRWDRILGVDGGG